MDSKDAGATAAAGAASEVSRPRRIAQKLKAWSDYLLVAGQVALSCYWVREEPRRPQLLAVIAVAYAAAVALTLLARWLDARVPHGARELWMKLAARFLASLVIGAPNRLTTSSIIPIPTTLLFWFIWTPAVPS